MHTERDRNDDYYSKKPKKPDQYFQQQQQNTAGSKTEKARYERSYDNRQSRQGSEPRAASGNNFSNTQDAMKNNFGNSDRNRDTRSSEPGNNHYEHRNKPPSGQPRISNAVLQRLPPNIDSLPPRLKKKYLLEAGLSEDYMDKPIMDNSQSYSNTLPAGRGRNNRYDQQSFHQNYPNSYQLKYNNNHNQGYQHDHDSNNHHHRSLTPPLAKSSRQPQQQQHQPPPPKPQPSRYDWKTNDIQRRDEASPANNKTDVNFDWSEDVLNSQSLPHDVNSPANAQHKYEDNNRHRRRRRNRR